MSNPVNTSPMNLRKTTPSAAANHHSPSPKSPPKTPLSPNSKSPFVRLFTQEDEIKLLKTFKRSLSKNPNTTPSSISFRQFTHAQISSKLKRLKEKYHKMAKTKSKIKTSQDRKIYSLARKLWGKKKVVQIQSSSRNAQDDDNFENANVFIEDGMDFDYGNGEKDDNLKAQNEETSKNMFVEGGKDEVDLGKFPFLMEEITNEMRKIGDLYLEGLKRLGEGKLKELDDKWMVLSMLKAEIETERSLLFQKQFLLVADARRRM